MNHAKYEAAQLKAGFKVLSKEQWYELKASSLKDKRATTYYKQGKTMYGRGYFEESTHTGLACATFVPPDKQMALFPFWMVF